MITEKMRAKSFGLFALSILALVLVAGLASAVTVFSDSFTSTSLTGWTVTNNPTTLPGAPWTSNGTVAEARPGADNTAGTSNLLRTISTSGFQSIVVKYDRQLGDESTNGAFESADEFKVLWSVDGVNFNVLEETGTTTLNDTAFVPQTFNLLSSANNNANFQLRFECTTSALTEFCRLDNVVVEGTVLATLTETSICAFDNGVTPISEAELEVSIRDVTVTDGFGSNEDWLLFDEVEVEVRVENNGNFDLDDISLEWAIADDSLTDFAVDWDEVDEFNLKDGDEDTFTVTFKVDDEDLDLDLDELAGNWNLVVRATGTIDDPDNGQFNNDDTCSADFEAVSVDQDNAVVLTNINVPDTLQCGQTYTITADAWNIGNDQEDEVKVDVFDRNRELIDELFDLGDIDEFENVELSFDLRVPQNAEAKTYTLVMRVLDEDSDVYEVGGDDDPSEFFAPLTVSGGCTTAGQVSVTANVVSGGREGQELVVRATVTNNGNTQQTYALNVAGHEDWASSASLDRSTLTLAAGQSQDVVATLDVNDNAAGSRTFFLELMSDGDLVRQPVSVSVAESRGLLGLTGNVIGDNWYLWGIGLLNVLLVVVIIVVAVRIARRK